MTNKIEKQTDTKFLIDGVEFMRVGGVWFRWDKHQVKYVAEDKPEYEKLYQEVFVK